MWQYGPAEVEVRVRPVKHAELQKYVDMEMEHGTEVAYLLRQVAETTTHRPRKGVGRVVDRVLRALAKVTRARPTSNARRPGGRSSDPARRVVE